MEPFVGSLVVYFVTFLLCQFARSQIDLTIEPKYQLYAKEYINTLQMCMFVFENSAFLEFYGTLAFVIALTAVGFACRQTFKGTVCNPATLIVESINGDRSIVDATILLLLELFAGASAFRLSGLVWPLQMHPMHARRYVESYLCVTDLKVPIVLGILIEGGATLASNIADRIVYRKVSYRGTADAIASFIVALIVVVGLEMTGCYFNPVLATALSFGCHGLGATEHAIVYWLGPVLGLFAARKVTFNI